MITTLILLSLAAFRLTRLVTTDTVTDGIRNQIWKKFPPSTKLGYLITCNWCTGFWVSLLLGCLWLVIPEALTVVSLVLAVSALVGLISAWSERQ
jgi:hypothetical protein